MTRRVNPARALGEQKETGPRCRVSRLNHFILTKQGVVPETIAGSRRFQSGLGRKTKQKAARARCTPEEM
jgi:hypothetical protein